MSFRSTFAAVALAGATATVVAAQPPQSEDEIVAWAESNGVLSQTSSPQATWSMLGADDTALVMGGIIEPRNNQGAAVVGQRMEFFTAADVGAGTNALSLAQIFDVNCENSQVRLSRIAVYSQRNLSSEIVSQPGDGEWMPAAETNLADAATNACYVAPTYELKTPEQMSAWVAANLTGVYDGIGTQVGQRSTRSGLAGGLAFGSRVVTGGPSSWLLVSQLPGGAVLRSLIDAENSVSQDSPRFFVRLEWYEPMPGGPNGGTMLSQMIGYEINCGRSQVRQVSIETYAEHNFNGASIRSEELGEFTSAAEHPIVGSLAQDVCVEARPRRGFITN